MNITLATRRSGKGWTDFEGPKEAQALRALEQMVDLGDAKAEPVKFRFNGTDYTHRITTKSGVIWYVADAEAA